MNSVMIRPVLPVLPNNPIPFSSDTALSILTYTAFLIAAGMIAFLLSLYASNHFKDDQKKTALAFVGIALAVSTLLLCFFGCAVSAVQGILFCLILLYCSYSDIRTREVSDYLSVMIMLTAFIGRDISEFPFMFLAAVLIALPMLLIVIVCKGKTIGGADVKLSAACAFLLGIAKGFVGLIVGLTFGILVNIIIQMKKKKTEGFPLVPYLAAGFMTAFFV